MNDPRYAQLFDVAFEACSGINASERKRRARSVANQALRVVRSGAVDATLTTLTEELTPQVGARAARAIARIAKSMRPAAIRRPLWRPSNQPKIAIMTANVTADIGDELYSALKRLGADVWYYRRSIRAGRRIRNEDDRALADADYVVFLVSHAALVSNFVQYEGDVVMWLEMADRRERLIPVVVDDVPFRELPPWLGVVRGLPYRDLGVDGVMQEIKERVSEDRNRRR